MNSENIEGLIEMIKPPEWVLEVSHEWTAWLHGPKNLVYPDYYQGIQAKGATSEEAVKEVYERLKYWRKLLER